MGSPESDKGREEDEGPVRSVVTTMLKRLSYNALTATNGKEALALYDSHRDEIAAVLSDVVMPEMGGMELCRELRKINPELKIVLSSGYSAAEAMNGDTASGVAAWLPKPPSMVKLAEAMAEAVAP